MGELSLEGFFAKWVLDAQAAEIPLGIDGDDGRRIQAVKDILISYFNRG